MGLKYNGSKTAEAILIELKSDQNGIEMNKSTNPSQWTIWVKIRPKWD